MDFLSFVVGFVAGYAVSSVVAGGLFMVIIGYREQCPICRSRQTSQQYTTGSSKRYLVCHRCGFEEKP